MNTWPGIWLALLPVASVAQAGSLDDWNITGSNTVRLEHYGVSGDPATGPYAFDGNQKYDEFGLNAVRLLSPYDKLSAQLYGVVNGSDYRSADRGIVPERISITREKGDAGIPYRAEAGDYLANFSYRTLQTSLKGVQVELQPPNTHQSVVLVSGISQPSWHHVQDTNDWVNGASWLAQTGSNTNVSVNLVHDARSADSTAGTPERKQNVASVAVEHGWERSAQKLGVEAELAHFSGDYAAYVDPTGATVDGLNRSGNAAFVQLKGKSSVRPLDYRLRYERYGSDYRPIGATVTPGRSSVEAHAGWTYAGGLVLRGRAQHFVDNLQSANELKTNTIGLNWMGTFFAESFNDLSGSVDLFRQDSSDLSGSVDRDYWNLNAAFSKPLAQLWTTNFGIYLQHLNDRVPGAADVNTGQLQLAASHLTRWGDWATVLTPGVTVRRVAGGSEATEEFHPSLALRLARGKHSIDASYGFQRLNPDQSSQATVDVNSLNAAYRYVDGQDTFGVEALAYDRRVTVGQYNDTWRGSVFWTHVFDKPVRRATSLSYSHPRPSESLSHSIAALFEVHPGDTLTRTLDNLAEAGFGKGVRQANAVVYDVQLLDEISRRQRFVIEHEAGRITRVALVVNVDDPSDAQDVSRTYERIRKEVLNRLGSPALNFEEGAITPALNADLNAGRLLRTTEWNLADGVLRLGIPRRLDGQVRIDIQHARRFGAPQDTSWGLDQVI